MASNLLREFREFAVKGNVIDLAVGIIVGAAFGKIVSSVVADVIMPPIGVVVGGVDFSDLRLVLKPASEGVKAVTLNYGAFLQTIVDFTIVAFSVFLLVKGINAIRRQLALDAGAKPAAPSAQEVLLTEIRDILKNHK